MTTPSSKPGKPGTPKPASISDDELMRLISRAKPESQDGPKHPVDPELSIEWPDGDDSLLG